MNIRTLQTTCPPIRRTTIGVALCLAPAIFAQLPPKTSLVTEFDQSEARITYYRRVLAGTSVSEGPISVQPSYAAQCTQTTPDTCKTLTIDNISLEVAGSGGQTFLVTFWVNMRTSQPVPYYFLVSLTTTFAGGVPIGILNQPTRIRLKPGDTLDVTFNGSATVPASIDGAISGYYAPDNTSLPF